MANDVVRAEVRGLEETQREMERIARDLTGPVWVQTMKQATLFVTREAKKNAPVDTGRLRASITPEIRTVGKRVLGVVGSNVSYAARIEEPGPVRRSGRRPWLRPAFEENQAKIMRILGRGIARIIR